MKRLFIIIAILVLIAGCVPDIPEPESPIDCEGSYLVYFSYCGLRKIKEPGTYWINPDERVFVIDTEPSFNPVRIFGECPANYIYELEVEEKGS
jgi:hypothetical protein